jgi:vacuolar-type H+-ATPase subunit I/STV1
MNKVLAPLLLSIAVVSGCATTGGTPSGGTPSGGTPSKAGTAALECGAAGAAAALLICQLAGGSGAACAAATAGTALFSAGACYGLASHYEQRRKDLAGKEQDVDALLAFAKTNNAEAEKTNQQLNAKLIEVSTRTDMIALQIQQGTITSSQLAKEKEALQKERQAANEQVEVQKVALQDMKSLRSKLPSQAAEDNARTAELDAEIAKQERLLAEAQRATTAFATQSGRI